MRVLPILTIQTKYEIKEVYKGWGMFREYMYKELHNGRALESRLSIPQFQHAKSYVQSKQVSLDIWNVRAPLVATFGGEAALHAISREESCWSSSHQYRGSTSVPQDNLASSQKVVIRCAYCAYS